MEVKTSTATNTLWPRKEIISVAYALRAGNANTLDGFHASQFVTNALTNEIIALQGATGALNTAVGNLNTATGALNTAVGNLQAATNVLNLATNSLQVQIAGINTNFIRKWTDDFTMGLLTVSNKLVVTDSLNVGSNVTLGGALSLTTTNIIEVMGTNILALWPHTNIITNMNAYMLERKRLADLTYTGGVAIVISNGGVSLNYSTNSFQLETNGTLAVKDKWVDEAGDTMTGTLTMAAGTRINDTNIIYSQAIADGTITNDDIAPNANIAASKINETDPQVAMSNNNYLAKWNLALTTLVDAAVVDSGTNVAVLVDLAVASNAAIRGILSVGTNQLWVMGTNILTMWPHRNMVTNLNADIVDGYHATNPPYLGTNYQFVEQDPQVADNMTNNSVPRWNSATTQLVSGTIFDNGKIGIGTTNPAVPLHIGSTRPAIRLEDTTTGEKDYEIIVNGNNFAIDEAGVASRLIIDTSGNVGIGTASPGYKLTVAGGDIWTSGDIYLGARGIWLSGWLNQPALTSSSPTFGGVEIQVDNADSKLRFHDPGEYWYSMGIDRDDAGKFKINRGGNIGDNNDFTINTAGNVGIGTTSPVTKFHVRKTTDENIILSGQYIQSINDANNALKPLYLDGSIMTLNAYGGGNVGIGTSSLYPGARLDVNGNAVTRGVHYLAYLDNRIEAISADFPVHPYLALTAADGYSALKPGPAGFRVTDYLNWYITLFSPMTRTRDQMFIKVICIYNTDSYLRVQIHDKNSIRRLWITGWSKC